MRVCSIGPNFALSLPQKLREGQVRYIRGKINYTVWYSGDGWPLSRLHSRPVKRTAAILKADRHTYVGRPNNKKTSNSKILRHLT